MSLLFSAASLGNLHLRNRIFMSPMCMYSCFERDGRAGIFHLAHYGARALGGVGAILVEASAVSPEGRISPEDLGIWDDFHLDGLQSIAAAIHEGGAAAGIQLAHAGRKSRAGGELLGPSPLAFDKNHAVPTQARARDIERICAAFAAAAARAVQAGFDFIEVHAAHGYFLSSFLSPLTNRRSDDYGRDRSLILEQVLAAIRESVAPDFPITLRISAEDWAEGGNRAGDLGEMLAGGILDRYGIQAVHVSSGGLVPAAVPSFPGYQVPAAEVVRELTGARVIAGGLLSQPEHAESIIAEGRADFVFLGRELLRNPFWPLAAAARLGVPDAVTWPKQYLRAKPGAT